MEIIKSLDLLKKKINLYSINSEKYSTKIGLLVSIFLYAALIFLVSYYSFKIFNKEIQNIIIRDEKLIESPNINLTNYVPYIFRVEDLFSNAFINESLISLHAQYYNCKNGSCDYNIELNLTNCKVENFPNKYELLFNKFNLESAFCINFQDNPQLNGTMTLSGSWTEDYINYLTFFGEFCFDKSSCLSSGDLDYYLYNNQLFLSLYSLEENLNPLNYSVPEVNNLKSTQIEVANNMHKKFENYLTLTNITSDIGLVNEQNNYTHLYSNEIYLQDITYYNYVNKSESLIFGQFYFFSNNKVIYVNRNYMRLQNLISFVLSIFNTLIIIVKLLFGNFIDKNYYEDIINRFVNLNHLDRKEIYLQFVNENTKIVKSIQNPSDKKYKQKLNEREELVDNITSNYLNQNVKSMNNKM